MNLKSCSIPQFLILFLAVGPAFADPPAADREAILAMAGEYEVTFDFEETVSLQPGYALKAPYHEEATELVIVVEDSPERIVLQHLLAVSENRVVKHWKQVWTWQDTRLVEYQGREKWAVRTLAPEAVAGTWSQLVTQVDDSPRYESYGKWEHDGGFSRWQSAPTARPLPRREHTKRDDYEILLAVNRHAITPGGWVHEQDNLKQVLDQDGNLSKYLAREMGLNRYERTDAVNFTKAREYWERTSRFWGQVSSFWEEVEKTRATYAIPGTVGEKTLTDTVNEIAGALAKAERETPADAEVTAALRPSVN